MTRHSSQSGMVLVAVVLISVMLAILVPAMVWWSTQEGKVAAKQSLSNRAFHLAEAAVDRARWKLVESGTNWTTTSSGTLAGYNFDKIYDDIEGGTYAIKISSYPGDSEKRIVYGVGRDSSGQEVRKIKVVYTNSGAVSTAIRANKSASEGANVAVHWGPIMTGTSISISGSPKGYPRLYSAGNISPYDTDGAGGVNSDNVQWWSYFPVPSMPTIDFDFYKSSAQSSGASPCGGNYYVSGTKQFKGCTDTSGKTYYITGNASFDAGSGGNWIVGSIIVLGDITVSGNGGGKTSYYAKLPPQAWKEYGNAWSTYQGFDSGAPSSYSAAVAQSYVAPSTKTVYLSNVLVHGFLYTGGSQGLNGGGNGVIHGVFISANNAIIGTSNFELYYDADIASAVKITGTSIDQTSWDEIKADWPFP